MRELRDEKDDRYRQHDGVLCKLLEIAEGVGARPIEFSSVFNGERLRQGEIAKQEIGYPDCGDKEKRRP